MDNSVRVNQRRSTCVNINVGGKIFNLKWSTIKKFKNTRLEKLYRASTDEEKLSLCDEFDVAKREYFFDRHPKSFENVWNLLKSGRCYFDHEFCTANVLSDLQYWGVLIQQMPFCCIYNLEKKKEGIDEELEKIKRIMKSISLTNNKTQTIMSDFKSKIWNVMEHPDTSILARIIVNANTEELFMRCWHAAFSSTCHGYALHRSFINRRMISVIQIVACLSIFFIVMSTINLVVSTTQTGNGTNHHTTVENLPPNINYTSTEVEKLQNRIHDILEYLCIGWFTLEYFLRLISSTNRLRFLVEFLNIIDFVAIAPFYFTILITNVLKNHRYDELMESFTKIFQVFRVLRVLRVLKLARHSDGLQSLGYTLQQSYKELGLLVSFIVIGVFLFSSLVYFAERETNAAMFGSIPHTFWWSIISMTTVGYGDVYPQTIVGQVFASFCCVSGVLVIALPIPIIVSKFSEFYKDKLRVEKTLKRNEEMLEAQRMGNYVVGTSVANKKTIVLQDIMKRSDITYTDIAEIPDPWNLDDWRYMDSSSSDHDESSGDE